MSDFYPLGFLGISPFVCLFGWFLLRSSLLLPSNLSLGDQAVLVSRV